MKPVEPGELGILKLVFSQEADGRYGIRHALPVRLRPVSGDPDDLFRLKDDLLLAQPAYLSTIISALRESIVPVVVIDPFERVMRCLGTGFFVSASGLLVTAAHVVTDPIERNYGGVHKTDERNWKLADAHFGVMVSVSSYAWAFRPIKWAEFLSEPAGQAFPIRGHDLKLISDVAICQVDIPADEPCQPLALIQSGIRGTALAVGKVATAIGYGSMRDAGLEEDGPERISGDFSFDLYASTGSIIEHLPDNSTNRQALTPGPCFRASLKLPGGMSGSPIFDAEGIYVHGVVSSSSEGFNGLVSNSYGSMLALSMSLPIRNLGGRSLLDLLASQEFGMPRLNIAGA